MPEKNIKINDFTVFIWNFGFLLMVLAADLGLIVVDIYLESGGLKLILQNLTWPKEIKALFASLGLSPTYLTPPLIFGSIITVAAIASSFLFAHYIIGILGSWHGVIRRIVRRIAQARHPQGNNQPGHPDEAAKEMIAAVDELYPIFKITLFALIIGVIMFLYIFPRWTMPIAQLQLASKIWASYFQPHIQGNSITFIQPPLPDLNLIMENHRGEFSFLIVNGFPHALLMLHILIAFLTELFLLHTLQNLGSFEERHSEVISKIRLRITDRLRRFGSSRGSAYRAQEDNSGAPAMEGYISNDNRRQETLTPDGLNTGTGDNPNFTDNRNGNGGNADQNDEPTLDDLRPEDQQIRVIGGSEMISPAEAGKMPELYTVVENKDPVTGETTYLIYTNEFYQKLQEQDKEEVVA